MACIQACGSAEAYHAKHKSVVTEISKIAHNVLDKQGSDQGAITGGCIKNNTKGKCINILDEHNWSGKTMQPYPQSIAKGASGAFVHSDKCNDMAAVVYADEYGAGWLLAWSVSDICIPGSTNKVYVEIGPVDNYKPVNWPAIKAKLDASGNTSHFVYEDDEAYAQITDGNKATLAASYTSILK